MRTVGWVTALVILGASHGEAQFAYSQCRLERLPPDALCGLLNVPEDRSATNGRSLSLSVVVLPATGRSAQRDPIVFLAGGGVVPASRYASFLSERYSELRRNRDIVLLDQRGTWNSEPLVCPPPAGPPGPQALLAATRTCAAQLEQRADLRRYTTVDAVVDLEVMRESLGYDRLNLFGVSYGTKVAQVYLRTYPERVRAMVLRGVVPVDVSLQLENARSAQETLGRVFHACAQDTQCAAAFSDLSVKLDSVLARVAITPPIVAGIGPPITDRIVRNALQAALGLVSTIEQLPQLIVRMYAGDFETLAPLLNPPSTAPPAPRGVFLSIMCAEEMPLIKTEDVAIRTAGTFFGDAPVRQQMQVCEAWPSASLAPTYWDQVRAAAPALLLSGELDGITPPRMGAKVADGLPNAQHIVLPRLSHSDANDCIDRLVIAFLTDPMQTLDKSCIASIPELQFKGITP